MKHVVFFVIFSAVISVFAPSSFAQNTNDHSGNPAITGSLDSQFFHLNRISRSQDGFKLIRPTNLSFVQKNVLDSIQLYRQETEQQSKAIDEFQIQIQQLSDSLQTAHRDLLVMEEEARTIRFLGVPMSVGGYQLLVWSLILLLLVGLITVLILLRQHIRNSRAAKEAVQTLQDEHDTFRKKSLENQQILKRQLQDEINKGNAY